MPDLQRKPSKFTCNGLDLVHPPDLMPDTYYPYVVNARSIVSGTVEVRPGYTEIVNALAPVHSIRRLNNLVPGAAAIAQIFLGAGTNFKATIPSLATLVTGLTGNPLTSVIFRPDQSPEPWMYVADANRNFKANTEQTIRNIGIAPPTVAPLPEITTIGGVEFLGNNGVIADGDVALGWGVGGTGTGGVASVSRVPAGTTASFIVYDVGTTGWAIIAPSNSLGSYDFLQQGARLILNNSDSVTVDDVAAYTPFPDSAGIVDTNGVDVTWVSGDKFTALTPGDYIRIDGVSYQILTQVDPEHITLVTSAGIQAGVEYASDPVAYITGIIFDEGTTGYCSIALSTQASTLQRDSMLLLGLTNAVRVLSVTEGPDGLRSFRCFTPVTHAVGDIVRSVAAFRCYTTTNISPGDTIDSFALEFSAATGVGYATRTQQQNLTALSTVAASNRPLGPDDYMHISLRFDVPTNLTSGRILLDVDPTINDFTQNYYYREFTQADLTSITKGSLRSAIAGSAQWTELLFPISELQRVGSNRSSNLANVQAIRIEMTVTATTTIDFSSWWVSGSFGPNVQPGSPVGIQYRYRYRDSRTGARSVPGPAERYQLFPQRQQVKVPVTASTDPQVDTIDIEKFDPAVDNFVYAGSTANITGNFIDDTSASLIAGNPSFETNVFQPWPVLDTPKAGFIDVAGTSIRWVSGDKFDPNLVAGTVILIGDTAVQLYGQPSADGEFAEIQSNLNALTNTPYKIASPTILGQPLPVIFGPLEGPTATYAFGIGDPRNPGTLYWTNGNDLDSASDQNTLEVTSPSEPLVAGVVWQTLIFLASARRVFLITPSFNSTGTGVVFTATELTSMSGAFSPWAMCKGPQGVYMVGWDGIYKLNYNSAEYYSQQLYPLFPHDGKQPLDQVRGFWPVNLIDFAHLRLNYADLSLYFDYKDIAGNFRTMRIDANGNFWPHTYAGTGDA